MIPRQVLTLDVLSGHVEWLEPESGQPSCKICFHTDQNKMWLLWRCRVQKSILGCMPGCSKSHQIPAFQWRGGSHFMCACHQLAKELKSSPETRIQLVSPSTSVHSFSHPPFLLFLPRNEVSMLESLWADCVALHAESRSADSFVCFTSMLTRHFLRSGSWCSNFGTPSMHLCVMCSCSSEE